MSLIARVKKAFAPTLIVSFCVMHGVAIWAGLGGRAGLTNGWPLWRDDHPLYFHSALVTRAFLKASHTTAGYDPSFMAGYAKSVVFPASSTLPELVVATFGGDHPEFAYKVYVLLSAAALPWLMALSCVLWRLRSAASVIAVSLAIVYVWTDFPMNYATFGMLPYFLGIPLGLVATGLFARYCDRGGLVNWLLATLTMSLAVLVHLTTAMVIAPAALLAYLVACSRPERPPSDPSTEPARIWTWSRHVGVWLIPIVVLGLNAFWWLPGICLRSTKGPSDFAFNHPEGVVHRLFKIVAGPEAPIESILVAIGLPGLAWLVRRDRIDGVALLGFSAGGMFWGYLAGGFRALDFLQPGRHTYAFYLGLSLAAGAGIDELFRRLHATSQGSDRFHAWLMAGALIIVTRMVGVPFFETIRSMVLIREPFLSSRPSQRLLWVIERVRRHVEPGHRLLYEEGGKDLPGVPDPFHRGRFSGLIPYLTGVEVIGGPYLHASLTTNFTQFGEGKLFGQTAWDRDHFVRYATLYRPSAILCWSPHARRLCRANPNLIRIEEDDGTLLIGQVIGFGGDTIRGEAKVEATADRIRVREMSPGLDGTVVLRYHSVPYLTTRPSVACEPEYLEEDPVPFLRLRPPPGTRDVDLEMDLLGRP